ncbi:MAG: DUF5067 domain-containing protein [Enterorhabdus sp.]|jgi:hypothetical protein|nr:DUF5067 domain-containing protein [Enterorhabdus sp.]
MEKKPTSGLAVAGLVLGIIALFSAFVPLLNLLSFPFVLLAIIFGAIGLIQTIKGAKAGKGLAIAGLVLGVLALLVTAAMYGSASAASDYAVTIDDCRMTEDYEGNPAAVVTFTFTNNSEETTSPAVALHAQVFQNGTELEMAITTDNEDADKYMNDVKPGSSITYGLAYELEDTSDITVEVQELAAFNDVLLAGIAPAGVQPAFAGGRRQRAARGFAPPLIHRDLKPSNIVVSDGGLTIIDFGIARAFREGAGADTTHFGTRSYAPPEQFGYGQTDVRSGVYALGMLLYYLVTERDPDARVATGGFAEPDVPPMLRPVLQRACAFDPAARFSSVRALKAAFLAAMASALGLPR